MTPADLAGTHARANTRDRPWTAAEFAALLDRPDTILTGDERAFVLGRVIWDEAEILTVATDPAHRRQGLARTALAGFLGQARGKGATTCFLEVAEDNAVAKALYHAAGFVPVGERPGYYAAHDGTPVAALILRLSLGTPEEIWGGGL
jgi:[ribosomal protein S18]-alanine N-acetyltransferase